MRLTPHDNEWFAKWQRRIGDPIKNTKRYYYFWSIVKICTVILMPWGVYQLLKTRKYLNKYIDFANDCTMNGRTITNDGAPGVGKTFTGSNMAYFLAVRRWRELKSEYFIQKAMIAEWVKCGDTDKLYAFKSLEESYLYFAQREEEYIPCLVSSVPLREYGTARMSYKLTPEVFAQISRIPEYSVLFNDESGLLFGGDTSKSADDSIKDFWRFIRHFLDAMAVNTNQDYAQNGIYMRRSTDYINHINGQTWEMSPKRLLRRVEKKEGKFFDKISSGELSAAQQEYIGQELYFRKRYARTIGFRKVRHRMQTQNGQFVGDDEYYILPAIGCVEYDDRAYRNLYRCKDENFELDAWQTLVVDRYDRSEYDDLIKGSDK